MAKAETDLQKQEKALSDRQERVTQLREQVAEAQASRAANEQAASNEIYMIQLEGEEARLETQLAEEEHEASKERVEAAAVPVLDSVKAQMELAVKQREGVGVADKEVKEANDAAGAKTESVAVQAAEAAEAAAEANAERSAFQPAVDPAKEK